MSAELAILNKAKYDSGTTQMIFTEEFDSDTMIDVSDKFFAPVDRDLDSVDTHDIFEDGSALATYQFDGDATDLGGTYDGVETNTSYEIGNFDDSVKFNGTSSYINLGTGLKGTIKTFSTWIYREVGASGTILTDSTQFTNAHVSLGELVTSGVTSTVNGVKISIYQDGNSASSGNMVTRTFQADTEGWNHIVFCLNSYVDYSLNKCYVNGILTAYTDEEIYDPGSNFAGDFYIGVRAYGGALGGYNNSKIDQTRFFNRELSVDEAITLYNEKVTKTIIPVSKVVPTENTHDIFEDGSAIATYQFDGNSTDLGGTYNGTDTSVTYGEGLFDGAVVCNQEQYEGVNTGITLSGYQAFTMSGWFNLQPNTNKGTSVSLDGNVLFGADDNPNIGLICKLQSDGSIFYAVYTDGGNRIALRYYVDDIHDTWRMFTISYDGTDESGMKLYVNGVEVVSYESATAGTYTGISSTTIKIGSWNSSDSGWYSTLNGSVDQFRVFNRALTVEEITTLYYESANPYKIVVIK